MKEYCKDLYPDGSPHGNGTAAFYDHCALAYSNHRGNPEALQHEIFFDYGNMQWSVDYRQNLDNLCDLIMLVAIVAYIAGFKIKDSKVLGFCFVMNILLGLVKLTSEPDRYGIDYIAYLQQAAAVWNGETNYTKLSSNLGPCFYPAGHIWHYIPCVWLHLYTEQAEHIIRFGHHIIHTLINYYIAKIAFLYFKQDLKPSLRNTSNQDYNSDA
jgi:hypothetical protein